MAVTNGILNIKSEWDKKVPIFRSKVSKMLNSGNEKTSDVVKPFLSQIDSPVNGRIDYQKILNNNNALDRAKNIVQQTTRLLPTITALPINATKSRVSNSFANNRIKPTRISYQSKLVPTNANQAYEPNADKSFDFNASADENGLASLDVTTELPKLSTEQISAIISQHFSKSEVIKPSDAEGIYQAQQTSGMSALAILGIGALESGYGTSNIAKKKNNLWGWNATNTNPLGNATTFSPVASGALEFANSYLKTYYNKYGAKSITSAGTGNNPAGKGYAYNDDGSINSSWATSIGSIMKKFYQTAKGTQASSNTNTSNTNNANNTQNTNNSSGAYTPGTRVANTSTYNNSAAKGQCVWYVRGRAQEKLGIKTNPMGNANEMWYNAGNAKVSATEENIKPNMIVSYKQGTGSAGKTYGHVIYIEDVVGDTVYYTEGGSSYYKNGTDGVVKTATKQGILNGVNNNGQRFGSNVIGFIDVAKL